jgi:hypothetical protein
MEAAYSVTSTEYPYGIISREVSREDKQYPVHERDEP